MSVVNNMDFYNFFNINSYLDQMKLKGWTQDIRYIKDYVNTKISMFTYKNLPKGLTSRIIETALCFNNNLCFYKSVLDDTPILCRYLPLGEFDYYWRPTKVQVLALNGKILANKVKFEDIILVRDNTMDIIPFITLTEYISKIKLIETTLMKNIKQARMPSFFTGEKSLVATFNKIIEKCEKDDVFAMVDKDTVGEAFKQFEIHFPIESEQLIEIMKNYMNWINNSMGIYSGASQKRERLLVGEVSSQNDYTDNIYQDELNNRKEFVEQLNEKFDYKIELVESYKEYTEQKLKLSESYMVQTQRQSINDNGGDEV